MLCGVYPAQFADIFQRVNGIVNPYGGRGDKKGEFSLIKYKIFDKVSKSRNSQQSKILINLISLSVQE